MVDEIITKYKTIYIFNGKLKVRFIFDGSMVNCWWKNENNIKIN